MYFSKFRQGIIGIDTEIPTPFGNKKMIYADWVASGRLYQPIEDTMIHSVGPYCANTHTETSLTGSLMTQAYEESKKYIKREVNANENDVLIFSGSGMTDSVNKLQRILGLRIPEKSEIYLDKLIRKNENDRPIIFITHLEHHSNHTSWLETLADVEIINPDEQGLVDLNHFELLLEKYKNRPLKIASVSACSNVTGIFTPYFKIAEMIHREGGWCFVDFACSAPYVEINMHPENSLQYLDAIFLSPHKFLGGPGTPGILVMSKNLYSNTVPDNSGGGTVFFTTPWKYHEYLDDIEIKEDGGTPPFLQGIKAALSFKLKKEMGVENMLSREKLLVTTIMHKLKSIPNLTVLAAQHEHRIGAISFYIHDLHFNLVVRILNDYFGIQVRGGCACAGTYGHYLLNLNQLDSANILKRIKAGESFARPGWIRLSLHPTHTDEEINVMLEAIEYVAKNHQELSKNYNYIPEKNTFEFKNFNTELEKNFTKNLFYN
ncbi:MAG: aminotransferase class V-fold PLP-dependent enzyme [Saprospiraceae bacterium]|nr:aminotransferase class V-fold PLP-dependent enzyme [Saprospiraceae bacterium]